MIKNLTKLQLVVFVVLLGIVAIFVVPIIQREFYSKTASDYEPWDPDNINVVKTNIDQLNSEGIQINNRKPKLNSYKQGLDEGGKLLAAAELDTNNYISSLENIQPYVIFRYLVEQEDYDRDLGSNSYSVKYDKILNDINLRISKEAENYVRTFDDLLSFFNYRAYPQSSPFFKATIAKAYERAGSSNPDSFNIARSLVNMPKPPIAKQALGKFKTTGIVLLRVVSDLDTVVSSQIKDDAKKNEEGNTKLVKLKDDFNKKNFSINQYAVLIGIPFFIIAALLMYWYGLRAGNKIIMNSSSAGSEDLKIGLSFTLNTITVLLLILSLLILGLAKVIQENTLAALLGAIAGYILNTATDKNAASRAANALSPAGSGTPRAGPGTPPGGPNTAPSGPGASRSGPDTPPEEQKIP